MNDEIDLPTLQSFHIGSWSLQGDYRDNRKTISSEPYNYKNTLRMRSNNEWDNELNRSSFIDWDERRLEQLHVYRIRDIGEYENGNDWRTDIPLLSSSGLSFTGNGFKYTYFLISSSILLISFLILRCIWSSLFYPSAEFVCIVSNTIVSLPVHYLSSLWSSNELHLKTRTLFSQQFLMVIEWFNTGMIGFRKENRRSIIANRNRRKGTTALEINSCRNEFLLTIWITGNRRFVFKWE